jgi:hypothetical protein
MASQEVLTALEALHREIEKLEPAIKHVETALAVTKVVKDIPQKHIELLKQIKESDQNQKKELTEVFSKELRLLTEEFRKIGKDTEEIQKQVKYEQKYLAELREKTVKLYAEIEKINFPERIDRLDANVAGIMSAVQAIQGRLDMVERNITDRIRDMQDYQKETRLALQSGLEQTKTALQTAADAAYKKQQTFTYITWALVVVAIIITFILKK